MKQIFILGDSHARGLGSKLQHLTDEQITSTAMVMPGATSQYLTRHLNQKLAHLTPQDVFIYIAGANDIDIEGSEVTMRDNSNSVDAVLSHALHTNIVFVTTPLRYDNHDAAKLIQEYNDNVIRKIQQEATPFKERIKILDINEIVNDTHYTTGKTHLKAEGKDILGENLLKASLSFL